MKSMKHVLKVASLNEDKPTITFTAKQLPELKGWKVGEKYKLEIDVEQIGINKDEYGERGISGRFKVLNVKVDNDEDEDDEDEEY